MRICLVSPATDTDLDESVLRRREAGHSRPREYPLGILTLAAELLDTGYRPSILDLNVLYFEYLNSNARRASVPFRVYVADRLVQEDADIVGLGTICSSYPLTLQIARELKSQDPEALVLLGGPQASAVDIATLEHMPCVDFVLRGEADRTLPEFIARLENGRAVSDMAGLVYRADGRGRRNPDPPVVQDLDELPLPAFDLYRWHTGSRILPLEHGRGCPFSCKFCSTNDFFRRRFRLKSSARMIRDMDTLSRQYEVEYFDLMHDMFTVDRKRVVDFCEAMIASGRGYRWGCSARTDFVDHELLELMASAGCIAIFFGVESGSASTQEYIDKHLDIDEALRSVQSSCRVGMSTVVSMIVGFPEETREDLRATLNFQGDCIRNRQVDPHLHLLAPLAGTPLQQQFRNELVLGDLYADLSHSQIVQDANERELILQFPDLFPNFYSLPTRHYSRTYLEELREFMLRALHRFRWHLVAWRTHGGDLLELFESWKQWAGENDVPQFRGAIMRSYYCGWEFDRHFVRFLDSRPEADRSPLEKVLLRFEQELLQNLRQPSQAGPATPISEIHSDMRLALEEYTYLLQIDGDVARVVELLERNQPSDDSIYRPTWVTTRIDSTGEVELLHLPYLGAKFLSLCDGSNSVDTVLREFSGVCSSQTDMPPWDVATAALRVMHRDRLVRVIPAAT